MAEAELNVNPNSRRMKEVLRILHGAYPEAECSLTFKNPFELLVATILSAQCTDERVNRVTPALFDRFGSPERMSRATLEDIESLIRTTGFFRNKAMSLQEMSRELLNRHRGEVPRELESLVRLRGVGRKTANVVLGNAYGIPGMVVDTHVGRLARRMGFTENEDPVKVEHDLMAIAPREEWTDLAHLLIWHGREICTARKALCETCPVARLCPKIGVGLGGRSLRREPSPRAPARGSRRATPAVNRSLKKPLAGKPIQKKKPARAKAAHQKSAGRKKPGRGRLT